MENITTKGEAIEYAIEKQQEMSEKALSWGEVAEKQAELTTLAEKFDLLEEFKENGII